VVIEEGPVPGQPIRVALVECGGLVGDLIRHTVSGQVDISVVADLPVEDDLRRVVSESRPDIVICYPSSGDDFLGGNVAFFTPCPPAKVLAALERGRVGALWQLRPARTEFRELSPALLLDTIRAVVR
jgi:hypothetical protein